MITAKEFSKLMKPFLPLAGKKVLVAISGGVDSLALTFLLHEWAEKNAHQVVAVTVDHKLRRTSTLEAAWVKKLLKKHNIEHHTLTLTPPEQKTGLPAWARIQRYEAIELFGIEHEAYSLFLAHHQDDQIETILMRLMEGSHWRGLSGMYPRRTGQVLTYIRPLLGERKVELIDTLARFGITESVMDPTNDQKKQGRGFIRNIFLPTLKHRGFEDQLLYKLGAESLALRQVEDCEIEKLLHTYVNFSEKGYATLSIKDFKFLSMPLRNLLIAKIIDHIGAPRFPLKKKVFEEMMGRMPGSGTVGNCRLFVKADQFWIIRETRNYPKDIEIQGQGSCFYQGRFFIRFDIPRKNGFKIETLGKKRTLNLLKENEALKEKVKFPDIYFTLPCLTYLDEVVSVPHLCYCRDGKYVVHVESLFHKREILKDLRKGHSL